MNFKYFGLITGFFLIISSELGAMDLGMSNAKYEKIIKDLEEYRLTAEQLKGIRETLEKKYENKRPLAPSQTNLPSKRLRLDRIIDASPKKGGPFGEFRPNRPMGNHIPTRKNAIYIHTAVENDEDEYINYEDRINGANYLKDGATLHDALLDIDIKIRKIIKPRPLVYKRTTYSGLAKNFSKRTRDHRAQVNATLISPDALVEGLDLDIYSSRKIRWICAINRRNMKIRASAIADNLPDELMKQAEILIGYNFNTLAKGSTVLGDEDAYDDVKEFMTSQARIDKLKSLDLLTTVEDLKAEEDDFMLGIQ